jgi:pyruvate, orthophosphate dikinase
VARQFGKPAVVGATDLLIDLEKRTAVFGGVLLAEGDWISLDGGTGMVYSGELETMDPNLDDPALIELLSWADDIRQLGVWTNADYAADANKAIAFGAEGIGLCRTEHMFFGPGKIEAVRAMILSQRQGERDEALERLYPFQVADFQSLFEAMNGKPVVIRLIDPPLHEFLPTERELLEEKFDLALRMKKAGDGGDFSRLMELLNHNSRLLKRVTELHESNPMLGLRGVRLGILYPAITRMQVRAIFQAAVNLTKQGGGVKLKVMIPLVGHLNELRVQRGVLEQEAKKVMDAAGVAVPYSFGTMIEIPRGAITAGALATEAEFFSYGTNDLTQTTFGISRDDAEKGFLEHYVSTGIYPDNPFETLDEDGVVELMRIGVTLGRSVNPDLEVGICGEHGGDPRSIAFCHKLGMTYVSCSPLRVPVARLAAAHAALTYKYGSMLS